MPSDGMPMSNTARRGVPQMSNHIRRNSFQSLQP
jgi:hypothetical protein